MEEVKEAFYHGHITIEYGIPKLETDEARNMQRGGINIVEGE